jgi:hypothetical protein
MHKIIITIIAFVSLQCHAGWDDWSDTDKKLFVASQIAITADWATTRYGSRHFDSMSSNRESNILLGLEPSTKKVDLYFIGLLATNYYITDWMPSESRGFYLSVRTVSHGIAAKHNASVGWYMRF